MSHHIKAHQIAIFFAGDGNEPVYCFGFERICAYFFQVCKGDRNVKIRNDGIFARFAVVARSDIFKCAFPDGFKRACLHSDVLQVFDVLESARADPLNILADNHMGNIGKPFKYAFPDLHHGFTVILIGDRNEIQHAGKLLRFGQIHSGYL